jgi:C4-dicarboxylate transporter, DctM subunit
VGLNLLVAMSVFKRKFGELVMAAVPFIALMLGCLAVIVWQPWISLTLLGR